MDLRACLPACRSVAQAVALEYSEGGWVGAAVLPSTVPIEVRGTLSGTRLPHLRPRAAQFVPTQRTVFARPSRPSHAPYQGGRPQPDLAEPADLAEFTPCSDLVVAQCKLVIVEKRAPRRGARSYDSLASGSASYDDAQAGDGAWELVQTWEKGDNRTFQVGAGGDPLWVLYIVCKRGTVGSTAGWCKVPAGGSRGCLPRPGLFT